MGKRVIVAVVLVPVLLAVLFLAPDWGLPIAISVLAMVALHEVLWSTGFVKNPKVSGLAIVLAGLIPFWVFVGERMLPALVTLFIYVFLLFAVAMTSHCTVTMEKMGGSFFLSIMIPYFLSTFIRLREMPDWNYYILLPFVVAWLSDAFALFAGMLFGKHKLAPELSPKKTVEGCWRCRRGCAVHTPVRFYRREMVRSTRGPLWTAGRLCPVGRAGGPVRRLGIFLYQTGI